MRALLFSLFLHDFLYDLAIIQLDYYDVKSCWLRGEINRDAFTHIDCVEDTYTSDIHDRDTFCFLSSEVYVHIAASHQRIDIYR